MRHLLRILLNALSVLSLLLLVASVVLWARSYWIEDALGRQWKTVEQWEIASSRGQIAITHELTFGRVTFRRPPRAERPYWDRRKPTELALRPLRNRYHKVTGGVWAGTGFYWTESTSADSPPVTYWKKRSWLIPHWLVTASAAIMTLAVTVRRTRPRRRAGLCPSCGYDLRATPGRCPECGAVPDPADSTRSRPGVTRA